MAAIDDVRLLLTQVGATLEEVATDVDDLVANLGEGGLTPEQVTEVKDKLSLLATNLRAVADKHTPA